MNIGIDDKIIPSLNDIVSFAVGCGYSPNQIFIKDGRYCIPDYYNFHNGIGIFNKENLNIPLLVFDYNRQTIYILDQELLKLASDKLNINISNLSISYKEAFSKIFNFNNAIDDAINSSSTKDSE